MRDADVPPGFKPLAADLVCAWREFVGSDAMWARMRVRPEGPSPSPSVADALYAALGSETLSIEWAVRCGASVVAVASAAARCCAAAIDQDAGGGGAGPLAWAALFDACVLLLCVDMPRADETDTAGGCDAFVRLLRARSPHTVHCPATRTDECPVETIWLFRDTFLMGPMRSGGSAVVSRGGGAATTAARGTDDADDGDGDDNGDGADDATAAQGTEGPRVCEHLPASIPASVYARHDRQDAVFTMLNKGWPHKLQHHETYNVVVSLLADAGHHGSMGSGSRVVARRIPAATVALCRWWAYARLGRWPGDTPLCDWSARATLVRDTDFCLARAGGNGGDDDDDDDTAAAAGDPATATRVLTAAERSLWRVRILGTRVDVDPDERAAVRARHVAGATLAIQAVVIESVRRLAPLRQYLLNHSRWADFERESAAARRAWRDAPCGETPVPAFFSDLMTMAPRDTDPNMWLVHVGRYLRSRNVTAAPLPPAVDRSFRIGIAAIPDLMRLAWPLVAVARAAAAAAAAPGGGGAGSTTAATDLLRGMTRADILEVQYYVGYATATGEPRAEWDARVPMLTVCGALALAEVVRAALAGCGVDTTGCVLVFKAIRDLYVCTTGPRVQATVLVRTLMQYNPRVAGLLVALHNVCVDHAVLRSTPLDAHTTALQVAARSRRVGIFSGGRDDWLLVCHHCKRPHTLVSEFEARPVSGTSGARGSATAASKRARASLSDHGFRKVAVDVRGQMTLMCNQRLDGVRELVYPVPLTGRMVWFKTRCYTICPQCGAPMQFNPQLCAYVNYTFACANCTALVADHRRAVAAAAAVATADPDAVNAAAAAAATGPRSRRAVVSVVRRVRVPAAKPPAA